MTRTTGQLCLAIIPVFLAGFAADGQTEPAPKQSSGPATVVQMLRTWFAPSATATAEGTAPAQARTNPEDAVPAVKPPTAGVAPPAPGTAITPAAAQEKIAVFLLRNCAACHASHPVVPQFDVTKYDALVRQKYLVPGQPADSPIWRRIWDRSMPPPSRLRPLAEQGRSDLELWVKSVREPQLRDKDILATLEQDPQHRFTRLLELGKKAYVSEALEGGGPYTILAPTDEAFERFNKSLGETPNELLWSLLVNHGILGKRSSEQLEKDGKVTAFGEQEFKVERRDGVLFIGGAKVLQPDVACSNGVIHVIDRVLSAESEYYIGRTGIRMEMIPAGEFQLGSPSTDTDAKSDEQPQVPVKLSSFWLGQTEVTQAQYSAMMAQNPSFPFKGLEVKKWPESEPVQTVTWMMAAEFCNKVSIAERRKPYYEIRIVREGGRDTTVVTVPHPAGTGYRLPTEAEWEYACRAGSKGKYCFGDDPIQLMNYAVFRGPFPALRKPRDVRGKLPNAWGLHDMHGNVHEWCQDWYASSYPAGPQVNPPGPQTGTRKVYRGGSYLRDEKDCRCAARFSGDVLGTEDDFRAPGIGFRLACTLGAQGVTPPASPGGDRSKR